jgi:hypothetical protein
MEGVGKWVLGGAMGVLSLIGLIMARNAVNDAIYWTGLLVFAFGVLFIYGMVARYAGGRRDS